MTAFVVDLGATWLRTARYTAEGGLSDVTRRATPDDAATCREAIAAAWQAAGRPVQVGIAAAPSLASDGRVTAWANRAAYVGEALLATEMAAAAVITVLDDGAAAAVSAHAAWGGRGVTLALAVGTGVGGGAVLEDRPLAGARGAAMQVGHVFVPIAAGRPCVCGRCGCVQALASGRSIAAAGPARREEALALAAAAVRELADLLAALFDPHRIALGGGLGLGPLLPLLAGHTACGVTLEPHPAGEAAGLLGAGLEAMRCR